MSFVGNVGGDGTEKPYLTVNSCVITFLWNTVYEFLFQQSVAEDESIQFVHASYTGTIFQPKSHFDLRYIESL